MFHRVSILIVSGFWVAISATATAAIPIDMTTGRPVVEVKIGNSMTLSMILDTGASGSVINADVARDLGFSVSGEQLVGDPSGRNQHMAKMVALHDVQIGGVSIGDLEAAVLDLPKVFGHQGQPCDGVMSLQALKEHLVTLDLSAGKMYLAQGQLDKNQVDVVPYSFDEMGIPQIQVLVGQLTVKAFVDTGSPGQLSLAQGLAKYLDLAGPLQVVGEGRTVSSTFKISAAPLAGAVKFAGNTIKNPTLNFDKLHRGTRANIGSGMLTQFIITIDQSSKLIRFIPKRSAISTQVASATFIH